MNRQGLETAFPPLPCHQWRSHGGFFATRQCTRSSQFASAMLRNRLGGNGRCFCRLGGTFPESRLPPPGYRRRILGTRRRLSGDIAQKAPQSTRYHQLALRAGQVPRPAAVVSCQACRVGSVHQAPRFTARAMLARWTWIPNSERYSIHYLLRKSLKNC